MRYLLLGATDTHGKGLSCHSRHSAHTGYLEKIGDMLGVVDLVEERLFVSINVHAYHKEVLRTDRHEYCLAVLRLRRRGTSLCRFTSLSEATIWPTVLDA